jgi:hypothetical protein
MEGSLADELPAALKQEMTAGAVVGAGSLYLIGEDLMGLAPFNVPGWRVTRLAESGVRPAAVTAPLAPAAVAK